MVAALLFTLALVQDTARTKLTLAEVHSAIRASNPRIAASRSLAAATAARVAPARRPPDPQVQFGLMNYSVPGLAPMDVVGMTAFQVMQVVPTAGKLGMAGDVAVAQAAGADERARDVAWQVRADASMAFYELYATDNALIVARETLRLLREVLATAESMYRVGEGRQSDVLRAQVEVARMIEDTLRMTTMRTAMAARLNAILDASPEAQVGLPVLPRFPAEVPALVSLRADARLARPMVLAAQRDLDAANVQVTLARREIWPDITVGAQLGRRRSEMGVEQMGSLMVGASVPVFAGARQSMMRQEATAMRAMAQSELAVMRATTEAAVTQAHANLVRARSLAALYRTTIIPQAEATVAAALAAYRVGSVDLMTLLDDRMMVNEYRQALFALDAEQGKAWAELDMLLGRALMRPDTIARSEPGATERP